MKRIVKRILFLTKSCLCQNLFELIVKDTPKKNDLLLRSNISEMQDLNAARPVHLLLIDFNVATDPKNSTEWQFLEHRSLQHAFKVLLHSRRSPIDTDFFRGLGFDLILTKPLPAEEITQIINQRAGGKS